MLKLPLNFKTKKKLCPLMTGRPSQGSWLLWPASSKKKKITVGQWPNIFAPNHFFLIISSTAIIGHLPLNDEVAKFGLPMAKGGRISSPLVAPCAKGQRWPFKKIKIFVVFKFKGSFDTFIKFLLFLLICWNIKNYLPISPLKLR